MRRIQWSPRTPLLWSSTVRALGVASGRPGAPFRSPAGAGPCMNLRCSGPVVRRFGPRSPASERLAGPHPRPCSKGPPHGARTASAGGPDLLRAALKVLPSAMRKSTTGLFFSTRRAGHTGLKGDNQGCALWAFELASMSRARREETGSSGPKSRVRSKREQHHAVDVTRSPPQRVEVRRKGGGRSAFRSPARRGSTTEPLFL
jgi:hypothetical protein